MSHSLVVKTASLVNAGDIAGAEYALVSFADANGDKALVAVLESLRPQDLLAVIREFDASKESVVSLLVTPEQFARAVVMEKLYDDRTHAHLRGMINSVVFRDDVHTADFIAALGEIDGGCEALVDYLADRDEEVVHFQYFDTFNINLAEPGDEVDRNEVTDHDWKELSWLLKHEHGDMFEQIWPVLKSRWQHRLRLEAQETLLEEQSFAALMGETTPFSASAAAPAKPERGGATDGPEESAL